MDIASGSAPFRPFPLLQVRLERIAGPHLRRERALRPVKEVVQHHANDWQLQNQCNPGTLRMAPELSRNTLTMAKMSRSRMTTPPRLIAVGIRT